MSRQSSKSDLENAIEKRYKVSVDTIRDMPLEDYCRVKGKKTHRLIKIVEAFPDIGRGTVLHTTKTNEKVDSELVEAIR